MPNDKTIKIFIIAGEASGDYIGSAVMASLKNSSKNAIQFFGIGGELMAGEGLSSLFPMREISLMGFAEIIPHLPGLLGRIKETVKKIHEINPDILITIDSPGFNYRVAKKITGVRKIHIVAPSVWAYKPGRAKKTAKIFNRLLTILPFEPPYFIKEGLPTDYIGHPLIEQFVPGNGQDFREKHGIGKLVPVILVMPGSRKMELKKLLPVFEETIALLAKNIKNLHAIILATPQFASTLAEQAKTWPVKTIVVAEPKEKAGAKAAANVALVKSGTAALEIALENIPMVVAYKVNPVSAWLVKRMVRVKFASLVNIILEREAVPEFIQEKCRPELLALELEKLLIDPQARMNQISLLKIALNQLGFGQKQRPSEKAAEIILTTL